MQRSGRVVVGSPKVRAGTKQAMLLELLQQNDGVTIGELAEKLGWRPNTVHSAISTLRYAGYAISIECSAEVRRYRVGTGQVGGDL